MPTAMIANIAKKSGKSKAEVEKIWDETKATAKKKFKTEDEHFWAYVNTVTHRKAGLKEAMITFKDYLLTEAKKAKKKPVEPKEPPVEIKVGDKVKVVKCFKAGDVEVGEGEVFQVQAVEDGQLQLVNAWGVKDQAKFIPVKHFEKVS